MAATKTDNSFISDKVHLRAEYLPQKDIIKVLDCYAGKGKIWKNVVHLTGRKIRRLPIDFKDGIGFHLPGDNMGYLQTIGLNSFDVIDLDAYGVPYSQIKTVFDRGYGGIVFITFIQSIFGAIPHGLLLDIGFTEEMINKSPALFYKRGYEYFSQWLALRGIKTVTSRSNSRKHYMVINCAEARGGDCDTRQEDKAVSHV